MTNPAASIRMLITYAICVPAAILVGCLLTNPMDYGTLGFLAFVLAVMASPIFIKWHYPMMIFALGSPILCFFLIGRPSLWQVMVLLSLGIAIIERAMSSQRQFIKASAITWPLIFILAVTLFTLKLTGGMGFHSAGGSQGGGRKYVTLFCGIAVFFALISRPIPVERRNLFIGLFFLSSVLSVVGDLFPLLPPPLNYINLLIPPTGYLGDVFTGDSAIQRLSATSSTAAALMTFMVAKWGVGGVFQTRRLWRPIVFMVLFAIVPLGGFRINIISWIGILGLMALMERRRGLILLAVTGVFLLLVSIAPFSTKLPSNVQRSLSFLPMNWSADVKFSAQGSTEWRLQMWRALWPAVPQYLLLGKGYILRQEDFALMGRDTMFRGAESFDPTQGGLAVAGDYHSGPLSTLIPFGIWGGIGMIWLMGACVWVHYRNYCFGPPELRTVNTFMLASCVYHVFSFIFVFGAYQDDVGLFARYVGFSIALNGGVMALKQKPMEAQQLKPGPSLAGQPTTAM